MDIQALISLANLVLTPQQEHIFSTKLEETLDTISVINELDTNNVEPVYQVTGLKNITRPDVVDTGRILSQSQAVSQAHRVYRGYIVVPPIK